MINSLPQWPHPDPAFGGVTLRRFGAEDVQAAMALSHDPYVSQIGTLPAQATKEQALEWLARQQQRYDDGAAFCFAVTDNGTGACVGFVGLTLRELGKGRGQGGYAIIPAARGQRFASDALSAMTQFGWTIPELNRIELLIEPWNVASASAAERAGYECEGLLRSHQEIAGQRRDMLMYSVVRSDANTDREL